MTSPLTGTKHERFVMESLADLPVADRAYGFLGLMAMVIALTGANIMGNPMATPLVPLHVIIGLIVLCLFGLVAFIGAMMFFASVRLRFEP